MISNLQFLLAPLCVSILLLAATSYFGIHVIKREIIFIDIALAQITALGGVVAMFFLTEHLEYIFSIVFCLGAALIFTLLKNKKIRVPIEAYIGIAYAFATTAAVIILDKGAGGEVHLHDMLTGALLWTTWSQVLRLALILLPIGLIHLLFAKQFTKLSESYNDGANVMKNQKRWDFLFYMTFGIVIIEAVRIAGVLTVFAFLILPASISALFSTNWSIRIVVGLSAGIAATVVGLYLSIILDVTASPLIIILLGLILLCAILVKRITRKIIRVQAAIGKKANTIHH